MLLIHTGCYPQPGVEVIEESEDGCLQVEWRKVGTDHTHEGYDDNEVCVQPVDMLVPVRPGDWELGDVRFASI